MKTLSTYHLIYELLSDGKGNLYPDLEPIKVREIMSELESRHKISFSMMHEYANWFIGNDEFPESEKSSVETMLRIKKIENKALDEWH